MSGSSISIRSIIFKILGNAGSSNNWWHVNGAMPGWKLKKQSKKNVKPCLSRKLRSG